MGRRLSSGHGRRGSDGGDPTRRPAVPGPRTAVRGLLAVVAVVGAGVAAWGLPVAPALGQPGTFLESPVTPTDLRREAMSNSPVVAADPADPEVMVMAHRVDGPGPPLAPELASAGCGLQVSGDGGKGWVAASSMPALPAGVDRCHAPAVAIDGRGTVYVSFLGLAGSGGGGLRSLGLFVARSSDLARTFDPPSRVGGPLAYGARLGVDLRSGRVHVAWLQAGAEPTATGYSSTANSVLAAYSDDGGATFSTPVVVAAPGGTVGAAGRRQRLAAPTLAVGNDGQVEVAFYDLGDDDRDYEGRPGITWEGRWSLLASRSVDGGRSFSPAAVVEERLVPPARVPSIFTMAPPALATGRQRTCVAWADGRHGDADVMLRCRGAGSRWGSMERVNQDPIGNGVAQYLPQLGVAGNGRVDVAFYDRRGHQRNEQAAVGYSYSYDGRRFSSNVAVSHSYHDPTLGPRSPLAAAGGVPWAPADAGSQLGLVSGPSSAVIAWADTRNHADGGVAQDIYSAQATLLFRSDRPGWAVPAGAAVVLACALALWRLRRTSPPQPHVALSTGKS